MTSAIQDPISVTRSYYDSADADNFYFHVWGGEDIHIGLYEAGETDIARASRKSVALMASRLPHLSETRRVLDLGAGYGGAARYLAKTTGCHVTALNFSATENSRSRALCEAAGLSDRIAIVEASFEKIPAPAGSFDVVWSQDALLHSGKKEQIFYEVTRVLRPGGDFIFTDPMESGSGSREDLQPVLDRIHLSSLGSYRAYAAAAESAGLRTVDMVDLTPNLTLHYARVGDELRANRAAFSGLISDEFIERMLTGLDHWVRAGERGVLAWGILHFRKP
ncbi:MAG: SAM-dependent methyltransferase [Rhodomicrobium sp.]